MTCQHRNWSLPSHLEMMPLLSPFSSSGACCECPAQTGMVTDQHRQNSAFAGSHININSYHVTTAWPCSYQQIRPKIHWISGVHTVTSSHGCLQQLVRRPVVLSLPGFQVPAFCGSLPLKQHLPHNHLSALLIHYSSSEFTS